MSSEACVRDQNAFTLADFTELLQVMKDTGYRFESFQNDSGQGQVILLRHDIDKDVSAARRIAEIEHDFGVQATYLFLTRTPLYSLLEPETIEHVRAISAMGHWVGLHCDERRMMQAQCVSEEDFDGAVLRELHMFEHILGFPSNRVVSFHNPSSGMIGRVPKTDDYISTYSPRYMLPATKYISDSNAVWREGNPLPTLRERQWPRLQILIHPIWWALESAEERIAILRATKERRLKQLDAYLRYTNEIWRTHVPE